MYKSKLSVQCSYYMVASTLFTRYPSPYMRIVWIVLYNFVFIYRSECNNSD